MYCAILETDFSLHGATEISRLFHAVTLLVAANIILMQLARYKYLVNDFLVTTLLNWLGPGI